MYTERAQTHSLARTRIHTTKCTNFIHTHIRTRLNTESKFLRRSTRFFCSIFFACVMHHGFLFASVNFVSVCVCFLRFAFAFALLYLFLLLFCCLYNMINVDVYFAVRSKRMYIEKWCSLCISECKCASSSVLRLSEKMKIREQRIFLRFSTFLRRASESVCGREMEVK